MDKILSKYFCDGVVGIISRKVTYDLRDIETHIYWKNLIDTIVDEGIDICDMLYIKYKSKVILPFRRYVVKISLIGGFWCHIRGSTEEILLNQYSQDVNIADTSIGKIELIRIWYKRSNYAKKLKTKKTNVPGAMEYQFANLPSFVRHLRKKDKSGKLEDHDLLLIKSYLNKIDKIVEDFRKCVASYKDMKYSVNIHKKNVLKITGKWLKLNNKIRETWFAKAQKADTDIVPISSLK